MEIWSPHWVLFFTIYWSQICHRTKLSIMMTGLNFWTRFLLDSPFKAVFHFSLNNPFKKCLLFLLTVLFLICLSNSSNFWTAGKNLPIMDHSSEHVWEDLNLVGSKMNWQSNFSFSIIMSKLIPLLDLLQSIFNSESNFLRPLPCGPRSS